jgi:hypothetical protein
LDSAGRPANPVFLQSQDYKVILKDSGGGTVWTQDPVSGGGNAQSITYKGDYTDASAVNLRDELDRRAITPFMFGAVGDGSTDDTAAIQAALDAAKAQTTFDANLISVDLCGRNFGLGSSLVLDSHPSVMLENGGLVAVGSSWSASDPIIDIQTGCRRAGAARIYIKCQHKCSGIRNRSTECKFDRITIIQFEEFGIRCTGQTQETLIDRCNIRSVLFGSDGLEDGDDATNRTGTAYDIQSSDNIISSCVGALSGIIAVDNGSLNIWQGCHFYNGSSDELNLPGWTLDSSCENCTISGCYMDKGIFKIKDSFNHIIDLKFQNGGQFNYLVEFEVTTGSNNNMTGLLMRGLMNNTVPENAVVFTENGGTFGSTIGGCDVVLIGSNGDRYALGQRLFAGGTGQRPGVAVRNRDSGLSATSDGFLSGIVSEKTGWFINANSEVFQTNFLHESNGHREEGADRQISDDAAISHEISGFTQGVMIIQETGGNAAMVSFNTASGVTNVISGSSQFAGVNDTALSGTSGIDGNFSISANSGDGRLYLENRTGNNAFVSFSLLAVR